MAKTVNEQNESNLNLLLGVKFSLLKTKLDAMYRKEGDKNVILLMPQEMTDNEEVSIKELVDGIVGMVKKANNGSVPAALEGELNTKLEGSFDKSILDKIRIKLSMLYLYINKEKDEAVVEYALRLDVITKEAIPEGLRSLIDVEMLTLAIWNTDRALITDKMGLYDPVQKLNA